MLQVFFIDGLVMLIFWKCCVKVWFFLKMLWNFWKVVELMQWILFEDKIGLSRLEVFIILLDVVLVLMMVWILLMNSIVCGCLCNLLSKVLKCFLKLLWYFVFVSKVFRLREQIMLLVSRFGIWLLMMCLVSFLVMVVLLIFVLFISSGLFLCWWVRICVICLILCLCFISGLICFW